MEKAPDSIDGNQTESPRRRARIWLDTCWLVSTRKDPLLVRELKAFITALHQQGIEPELAVTRTVFNEFSGVPDPKLVEQGLLDTAYIKGRHESNTLHWLRVRTHELCSLLSDLNSQILALEPQGARRTAVTIVDTRHCKKEDAYISNALVMRHEKYNADTLRKLADLKKKHPHFKIEPELAPLLEAIIQHDTLKASLGKGARSELFDFAGFEDCPTDNLPLKPESFFSDPLFHITSHDWLLNHYPCPRDRGEFSMMSGVKSCDSDIQIILSMDGIERLKNFDSWHKHNGRFVEVVHPKYLPAMTKAVGEHDFSLLHVYQSLELNRICQVLVEDNHARVGKADWVKTVARPTGGSDDGPAPL